jgi:tRNA dimethylallyltransferase
MDAPLVFALLGPTGAGKTALTQALDPERFEIVSCDSRQVYSELDIITAMPSRAERARIRHHVIDFLSPRDTIHAGRYVELARAAIADILERGKTPWIVGGAGFYFRALRYGLFEVETSAAVRETVRALSPEGRLNELRRLDPAALVAPGQPLQSGRLHPNDAYRVARALEITLSSGTPWSEHWRRRLASRADEWSLYGWRLELDTESYEAGLRRRCAAMIAAGASAEAERVFARYGACPGLETLGAAEALGLARGEINADELAARLFDAHRRYAKRQRTWLRSETDLNAITPEELAVRMERIQAGGRLASAADVRRLFH